MKTPIEPKLAVVYILPEALAALQFYIYNVKEEVSGLGTVQPYGNDLLIKKVYLFKQTVSPTNTKLDRADVGKFISDLISQGVDTTTLRLWWHSHGFMPVFWSTTDKQTIDGFGGEWMVSVVCNKLQEIRARLDVYRPLRLTIDGLDFKPLIVIDPNLTTQLSAEIEQKITYAPPLPPPPTRKEAIK